MEAQRCGGDASARSADVQRQQHRRDLTRTMLFVEALGTDEADLCAPLVTKLVTRA